MRKQVFFLTICFYALTAMAQDKPDAAMLAKIKAEGLNHSGVMDIAFHLTDGSGSRLMNSPGFFRAANWAKNTLQQWGLESTALEPWGSFGKGWELQKFYIAMAAPYYKPLTGLPKTWTSGTGGLKTAEIIIINAKDTTKLLSYSAN